MAKLIEPELSYKIVGLLFRVHSQLGCRYQEKYYQRAIELELKKERLNYKKEVKIDLRYNGKIIGRYYLDFVIEDRIVLELKTAKVFHHEDIQQVLRYLKSTGTRLGILVNFGQDRLVYKRIINNETK